MATQVYKTGYVETMDGRIIDVKPLKIKYLREFMDAFQFIKTSEDNDQALSFVIECVRIAMKEFCPSIKTLDDVEDSFDIENLYMALEYAANVSMEDNDVDLADQASEDEEANKWADLDLVSLESEAFMLGIWTDYAELEASISMPELVAILDAKREKEYSDQKFLAALQGVDLDEQTGRAEEDPWEAMKARVFSGGQTSDSNNILAYQGVTASKAGFGIGMGLDYEDLR